MVSLEGRKFGGRGGRRFKVLFAPRPEWGPATTPEQLELAERESFLSWRRNLARLEEEGEEGERLIFTPFEKNLQFWRQLWRVVERRYGSCFPPPISGDII